MLEVKDTVMTKSQILAISQPIMFAQGYGGVADAELSVAEAQAKISFPAGMKEVVGFVEAHKTTGGISEHFNEFCFLITDKEWQAFLKSKGVDNG